VERNPILLELEQRAHKDGVPIVSRDTARFLSVIVTGMQASRILEVGTAYGYSTLAMALAQPRMGRIWTIERNPAHAAVALEYFRRAGEDDYVELFNTPAAELLENFPHRNLDIAFVAGAPEDYDRYLELVLPTLKLSGLAIFYGCTSTPAFVRRFLEHPELDATILPIGEGTGIGARRQ
jgi:predicted O-methyltransferase YrrM